MSLNERNKIMKLFKNECAEIALGLTIMFSVFWGSPEAMKLLFEGKFPDFIS